MIIRTAPPMPPPATSPTMDPMSMPPPVAAAASGMPAPPSAMFNIWPPMSRIRPGYLDFADPHPDMVSYDQDAPHPPQGTFSAPIGQPYDGLFLPDLSGVSRIRAPDPGPDFNTHPSISSALNGCREDCARRLGFVPAIAGLL
jgi:hypothetical protein